jgi:hypothetical protein
MGNGKLLASLKKLRSYNTEINLRDTNRIIRRTEKLIGKMESAQKKSVSQHEKKLFAQELKKLHVILDRFIRFRAEIGKG